MAGEEITGLREVIDDQYEVICEGLAENHLPGDPTDYHADGGPFLTAVCEILRSVS